MQGMDRVGVPIAFPLLKNLSGILAGAPELTWLEIPTLRPFLLLREFFSSYYHTERDLGRDDFTGKVHVWNSGAPRRKLDSYCPTPRSKKARLLLSTRAVCAYRISWNSLVGQGWAARKRLVFRVSRKSEMLACTLNAVFEILA